MTRTFLWRNTASLPGFNANSTSSGASQVSSSTGATKQRLTCLPAGGGAITAADAPRLPHLGPSTALGQGTLQGACPAPALTCQQGLLWVRPSAGRCGSCGPGPWPQPPPAPAAGAARHEGSPHGKVTMMQQGRPVQPLPGGCIERPRGSYLLCCAMWTQRHGRSDCPATQTAL